MMNMPNGVKKHHKRTEPESHQTTKIFFLFFFFTEELWLHLHTIFFTCTHAHEALHTEMSLLKIAELEIWLVCLETGSLSSIVDSVFEQIVVNIIAIL